MEEKGDKRPGKRGRTGHRWLYKEDAGAGQERDKGFFRGLAMLATMGITMVVSTFIGLIIGIYLDGYFSTKPWLTIIFLIFGIAAGFRNIYIISQKYGH